MPTSAEHVSLLSWDQDDEQSLSLKSVLLHVSIVLVAAGVTGRAD